MPTDKNRNRNDLIDWGVPKEAGGHEDNSAIFSLQSLIEQAEAAPSSEGQPSGDDSGLIDLTALGAIQRDTLPRTALDLFTLPKHESAPEIVVEPVPAFRSRRAAWLKGAALFVAAAAVMAIGASGLSETRVEAAETGLRELAVAPIPVVAVEAPTAQSVKAAETKEEEEEEAVAEPKPVSLKKAKAVSTQARPEARHAPVVKKASAPPTPAKPPTPPPEKSQPKPPPVDPCHGDLMCAMKRATGG